MIGDFLSSYVKSLGTYCPQIAIKIGDLLSGDLLSVYRWEDSRSRWDLNILKYYNKLLTYDINRLCIPRGPF